MKILNFASHPFFVPFFVQMMLAYEWISAGWEKVHAGKFVETIDKTLMHFETGNPHAWYVQSVLQVAKHHPGMFGQLVQWGEVLTGIGLIGAVMVYGISRQQGWRKIARYTSISALCGGAFMSLNFYYAAGWTGVSTAGLNAFMFWMEIALLVFWIGLLKQRHEV